MKRFYTCTCPDFTRSQSFLVNSEYPSQMISRNWSDSDAGVQGKNKWCKHIYAVLIARGELAENGGIPKDVPLGKTESEKEDIDTKERYQQGYGGHDFTGGWGVRGVRGVKS